MAFYNWIQRRKRKAHQNSKSGGFVPVNAESIVQPKPETQIVVEIRLPNLTQLMLHLEHHQLVTFIQELSNAVTIVR